MIKKELVQAREDWSEQWFSFLMSAQGLKVLQKIMVSL